MAAQSVRCYRHPDEETRIRCTRCDRPICPECMHPAPVGHHCPSCVAEGRQRVRRRPSVPRPRSVTTTILAVNLVVFGIELAVGATRDLEALARMGAMVPSLVEQGQYWRLLTAAFLHADLFHVLFNSWALYLFGSLVEDAVGTIRFTALYVVTAFVGSATSFAFATGPRVSVGASGAIFGLLGAWILFNWRRRGLSMARGNLRFALVLVVINVIWGLTVPGIDNAAHLGGLAAGVLAGLAAEGVGRRAVRTASRVVGFLLIAALGVGLVAWGAGDVLVL